MPQVRLKKFTDDSFATEQRKKCYAAVQSGEYEQDGNLFTISLSSEIFAVFRGKYYPAYDTWWLQFEGTAG